MSTVRITYFDKEAVHRALQEYVSALVERHPELEEVILFGSLVAGTPVPGSDVDLMLILRDSDRPFLERIARFPPSRFPVDVDVFPYTRAEIERMTAEGNWLVRSALRTGQTLFRRSA
ncbi:MAG TPA: nucleotidyltransferase domain-containing protein [Methylomirabilota bacterium]|nr:nucleotidyltransferase domain-containing protein [Methylomirabilota bacterium]